MNQAITGKHAARSIILAALLAITPGTFGAATAADLATEFIHAPKFSEGEKVAIRDHFSSNVTASMTERRVLPRELMIALPRRDGRFLRLLVKDDVILLDRLTDVILDIIPNVTCSEGGTVCAHPDA